MEFPEISSTIRNDIFWAKLANDCLLQAQEHIARAIANREDAGENAPADLAYADQQIGQASETLADYAYVEMDKMV
ncbi:MAG: hypothetical protein ACXABY_02510 [Candidatus Thorarchaeota archaeon]|jgi:hypothetical protein